MKKEQVKKKTNVRRSSIQMKIVGMSVMIAMIPLLLCCAISATISMNNSRQVTQSQIEDRTDSVARQVQAFVQQNYSVMESLAAGTDIRSLDPNMQKNILVQAIENNPAFILLYQQDTKGDQTARTSGTLGNRADR